MNKKITTLFLLLASLQLAANELSWVDEQVEAIKPPRKGISDKEISRLKNPFIFLSSKKEKRKRYSSKRAFKRVSKKRVTPTRFLLQAILNKSALIDGTWYQEGENIYGYKIEKINFKSVLLTKGRKKLLLSTMSKSSNLKFNNK